MNFSVITYSDGNAVLYVYGVVICVLEYMEYMNCVGHSGDLG